MQRLFIIIGILFVLSGLFWPWLKKLKLGRLPGDIMIDKGDFTFYFPITTCIVISVIISLIWWFLNK